MANPQPPIVVQAHAGPITSDGTFYLYLDAGCIVVVKTPFLHWVPAPAVGGGPPRSGLGPGYFSIALWGPIAHSCCTCRCARVAKGDGQYQLLAVWHLHISSVASRHGSERRLSAGGGSARGRAEELSKGEWDRPREVGVLRWERDVVRSGEERVFFLRWGEFRAQ